MPGVIESATLQLRVAKRLARRKRATWSERLGRPDRRLVFVVGSPRSGTTFLGDAIGSMPGFLDLGETAPLKAAVPELTVLEPPDAARRVRRILGLTRRLGLVGAVRPVEQTPENAYIVDAIALAYPEARIVHLVRDGRDVVCSLAAKKWLSDALSRQDDAGAEFGSHARFWVEPERREEFPKVSDTRRAAWAWRRYVTAARASRSPVIEVRYEEMARNPEAVASELAPQLDAPADALATALGRAHALSIGRYRNDLSAAELAEVIVEAGDLLRELGYLED